MKRRSRGRLVNNELGLYVMKRSRPDLSVPERLSKATGGISQDNESLD
jgi:hypothetical protein